MAQLQLSTNEQGFIKEILELVKNPYANLSAEHLLNKVYGGIKKYQLVPIGAGTNRVALNVTGNFALKLPFRHTGQTDNQMELKLSKMASTDITKARRHARSITLVANSEHFLLQEKIIPINHAMINAANLPLTQENLADPKWIQASYKWLVNNIDQYKALIADLYAGANGWIPGDLTPDRVLNFGFKKGDDGNIRLAVLDYGLCFPKLVEDIKCPTCGHSIVPAPLGELGDTIQVGMQQQFSCGCSGVRRTPEQTYQVAMQQKQKQGSSFPGLGL